MKPVRGDRLLKPMALGVTTKQRPAKFIVKRFKTA
jgi:hypothetical protein